MQNQDIILSGALQDEKINSLKEVKVDSINWKIFYLDPLSGEKWIKEYPNSEMHGGGPSILRRIEKFQWE